MEIINIKNLLEANKHDIKMIEKIVSSIKHNDVLIWATNKGYEQIVSVLLTRCDLNKQDLNGTTALMHAVIINNVNIVSMLINNCCDVNIQDNDGDTALILATCCGYNVIVSMLIAANVCIDHQDNDGYNALTLAAFRGFDKIMYLLIAANCDLNIRDNNNNTALDYVNTWTGEKRENMTRIINIIKQLKR